MERQAKPGEKRNVPRPPGLRVFKTVFWSFFGVRRRTDNQDDFAGVTPAQIIVAGVVGAVIFVSTLVMLVKFITR
jgi:hypothetical protein